MTTLQKFYKMLKEKESFAYNRLGDGEIGAIRKGGDFHYSTKRSGAPVNEELAKKLKEALLHEQKNYWKGIICPHMYEEQNAWLDTFLNRKYEYLTTAWVFHTKALRDFWTDFPDITKDRKIIWISGNDSDVNSLQDNLGMKIRLHIKAMSRYSADDYDRLKDMEKVFRDGDVICINAGPIERVLIKEWFEKRPDVTFIGIGSAYDPFIRGVWYNHHKRVPKECINCEGCK